MVAGLLITPSEDTMAHEDHLDYVGLPLMDEMAKITKQIAKLVKYVDNR